MSESSTPQLALPSVGARFVAQDAPAKVQAEPTIQWRGPDTFVWRQHSLPIENLPDALVGLRILHLSDFHTRGYWPAAYDTLLAPIADHPPELLLFTGDFVEEKIKQAPAIPHVKRLVAGFRARLGCFGTLGNHDMGHLAPHLARTNVKLIDESRMLIPRKNAGIELIGFPGVERRDLKDEFLRNLPPKGDGVVRIVLSHFPCHLNRGKVLRPDLFLTGHTHGGQVCLPGGSPIITHARLPRRLAQGGVHRVDGNTWLVVNRGMGYSGLPLRVNCPAEVVELTLTK